MRPSTLLFSAQPLNAKGKSTRRDRGDRAVASLLSGRFHTAWLKTWCGALLQPQIPVDCGPEQSD